MSKHRWRSSAACSLVVAALSAGGLVSTASAGPRTIRAYESGVTSLGHFHPLGDARLVAAIHAFGRTSSRRNVGGYECVAHWRRLGLVFELVNYGGYHGSICGKRNGLAQRATIRGRHGRRWRTRRGIHVGSSTRAVRRRYPRARRHRGWVWLTVGITYIACESSNGCRYPVLRARTSHRHVRALQLWIGAAGE